MYRKVLLNKSEFSKIIFNDNINYFNPDILDDRLKNVYKTHQNKIYKNNTFDINKYINTDYYIDLVDMQYCDNKIYYYSIEKYKLNKNTLQFVNEKKNKTLTLQKQLYKYIIICNN